MYEILVIVALALPADTPHTASDFRVESTKVRVNDSLTCQNMAGEFNRDPMLKSHRGYFCVVAS